MDEEKVRSRSSFVGVSSSIPGVGIYDTLSKKLAHAVILDIDMIRAPVSHYIFEDGYQA